MKAHQSLESVLEKVVALIAFLPLAFMVYPETVAASFNAHSQAENQALVFEINSKQKTQEKLDITEEVNPTLINPCYPGPVGSCNPDNSHNEQPHIQAQVIALEKALPGSVEKSYSKEEVQQMIVEYSAQYGINPETPLCIARLESGYNQFSKNKRSSASGVFQYLSSTWRHTDEGKAGLSVFDADANIRAAVKYMAVHKSTQPWTVRSKCPRLTLAQ